MSSDISYQTQIARAPVYQTTQPSWIDTMKYFFGEFPKNYLVFDAETSGLMIEEDLALQIGQAVVLDQKCVYHGGAYVNWFDTKWVNNQWLLNRISHTAQIMAEKGYSYRTTPELMRNQGSTPEEAIAAWADAVERAIASGTTLVGHNIISFDFPVLCRHSLRVLGRRILVPPELLYDTGMIEKARLLSMAPYNGEHRIDFFRRVYAKRSHEKWGLSQACAQRYNLWIRSGMDPTAAHDAEADCVLTHYLVEAQRELLG